MAREAKTRSAALAAMYITTAKVDNYMMGYVENFNITEVFATELINAVGHQKPRENVLHGVQRVDFSWSETTTVNDRTPQALGLAPMDAELPSFNPITIAFMDFNTGEMLCEIQGALPSSVGITGSAMSSIKGPYSGSATSVTWGAEMLA